MTPVDPTRPVDPQMRPNMELVRQLREAMGEEACARADAGCGGWIGLMSEVYKAMNPEAETPDA